MTHEVKFSAPNHNSCAILGVLKSIVLPDGEFAANTITSLYFDTHNWDFLQDKASSDYNKTKVRIRYYDDGVTSPYFLEIKTKRGARRTKVREEIPKHLLEPEYYGALIEHVNHYLFEQIGHSHVVYPGFFIRYLRHRFYDPVYDTRIALDQSIQALPYFKRPLRQIQTRLPITKCVLEQKGEHRHLTKNLQLLTRLKIEKEAFSKYYLGYCALTGYSQ